MTADSLFETTSIPGHLAPTPERLERLLSKQTLEELYEVEEQPFARILKQTYSVSFRKKKGFLRRMSLSQNHSIPNVVHGVNRFRLSSRAPSHFYLGPGALFVKESAPTARSRSRLGSSRVDTLFYDLAWKGLPLLSSRSRCGKEREEENCSKRTLSETMQGRSGPTTVHMARRSEAACPVNGRCI
ncbi:hypothetical protein G5I_05583 [Acromyrmex echinatior]|uniref:Uncharacterized protein n=1 Tax=Acromyrmex echinatior TaxID=103372 RepID=F4WIQ9_ACREC|nr:hypothetical protein G5I_05583 [Acromyrmex echinatior]